METTFTSAQLINALLIGGTLGIIGQGIRIIIGLKKLDESRSQAQADANGTVVKEVFTSNRLLISIFFGFVAGTLAALVKPPADKGYTTELIMALIASGYAGADFIEGLFNTYFKKMTSTTPSDKNMNATGADAPKQTAKINAEIPARSNYIPEAEKGTE
ncbi:hypothetical protein OGH69_11550 [Flavobacterium sp. MFBS3-15]|uniref:hypothetical protein n=1 Tax=Flavobacterium sp. MFBS3-15 TaxID=2989816 RepID=UPI002235B63D|nr:hypothetical protein [Flavobacterium sp. MFBS3-15]MCW4469604.1 hypothetical protein [Flavobacterium sp. MFBS3-15]